MRSSRARWGGNAFTTSCFLLPLRERLVIPPIIAVGYLVILCWWWGDWARLVPWLDPVVRYGCALALGLLCASWLGRRLVVRVDQAAGTLSVKTLWLLIPTHSASYPLDEIVTLRVSESRSSTTAMEFVVVQKGGVQMTTSLGSIGALGREHVDKAVVFPMMHRIRELRAAG